MMPSSAISLWWAMAQALGYQWDTLPETDSKRPPESRANPKRKREFVFQVYPFSGANLLLVSGRVYNLDVNPSQDASGKWRFRLGSPTENVIIMEKGHCYWEGATSRIYYKIQENKSTWQKLHIRFCTLSFWYKCIGRNGAGPVKYTGLCMLQSNLW